MELLPGNALIKSVTIFRPIREEVTGGWKKLQTEKLQNVYLFQNIVMATKPSRVGEAGYVPPGSAQA
jgi:hypothetical protein